MLKYDFVSRVLTAPKEYAELYNFAAEQTCAEGDVPDIGFITNDTKEIFADFWKSLMNGVVSGEALIQRHSRPRILCRERYSYCKNYDADGKPIDAVIFIENLFSPKETPQRIDYERQLRLEITKEALEFYIINLSANTIEEFKSRNTNQLILTPHQAITEELEQQLLQDIPQEFHDIVINNVLCNALRKAFSEGRNHIDVEVKKNVNNDGYRWVLISARVMERPDTHDVIAFSTIRDIDERKKEEVSMHKTVRHLVYSSAIININKKTIRPIAEVDLLATDISQAPFWHEWMHTKRHEMTVNGNVIPTMVSVIKDLQIAPYASCRCEEKNAKGAMITMNVLFTYVDESKEELIICALDITDVAEAEKEQKKILIRAANAATRANKSKSDFLFRMSHDMRTPLNAILNLAKIAKVEKNPPNTSEYLQSIDASGKYLLSLINDTLDIGKIESGKVELNEEPYSLVDFMHSINTTIRPLMDAKNIEFVFDMGDSAGNIRVDKTRFCQIFFNLLSNAAKYTPEGGKVEFTLEHIPNDDRGRYGMRYHVKDNGVGMSKEFQKHMFNPYSREINQKTEGVQGTGLGLPIVKKLVDLTDGKITVISELGKGTEFIVDLYAYFEQNDLHKGEINKKNIRRLVGMRVLLVEDNELNTFVATKLLMQNKIIVDTAVNGLDGVKKFIASHEGYYGAILMDMRMPIMNGAEATKRIRALPRADAKTVPIIAMTADVYTKSSSTMRRQGLNAVITKPIDFDLLTQIILQVTVKPTVKAKQ